MDWAEELKMSFRKTTARKGRRAKSREATTSKSLSSTSVKMDAGNNTNNDIIQDITLDLQQTSSGVADSSLTTTPPSTSDTVINSGGRHPPRRISGGWAADNSVMKILKSKKNSLEDERFQNASATNPSANSVQEDNIPIIPDLDDVKDEILMNEIVEPPNFLVGSVTLKELNLDLFSHNTFSAVEDVDLTILTRCLQGQETLDEPDELWEWEKLFTDVIAEIHSDKITAGNTSAPHTSDDIIKTSLTTRLDANSKQNLF